MDSLKARIRALPQYVVVTQADQGVLDGQARPAANQLLHGRQAGRRAGSLGAGRRAGGVMPLYEYRCPDGHLTEDRVALADYEATIDCPRCLKAAERVFTIPEIRSWTTTTAATGCAGGFNPAETGSHGRGQAQASGPRRKKVGKEAVEALASRSRLPAIVVALMVEDPDAVRATRTQPALRNGNQRSSGRHARGRYGQPLARQDPARQRQRGKR